MERAKALFWKRHHRTGSSPVSDSAPADSPEVKFQLDESEFQETDVNLINLFMPFAKNYVYNLSKNRVFPYLHSLV